MSVRESEHQSPHLIADIEVPANLKTVHCFERTAEQKENKKRPPAEAQISVGFLGSLGAGGRLHYSDRMIRLSSRSLWSRWKISFCKLPLESSSVSGRYVAPGERTSRNHFS